VIAEILCVGTELLIGDVVNTNATYISKRLSEHGIDVLYHSVCGDNPERLEKCLNHALLRSDIVVTTGGLGPTYDDITAEICARALGIVMCDSDEVEKSLEEYFRRSGRVMTDNNKKQAKIPKGAKIFTNNYGTAPGICIEKNGKIIVMMPGPPREMKPMTDDEVIPYLSKYTNKVLVSSNVNIFGMGESSVETKLHELMLSSINPTVAPYINDGEVRVRVTASAENENKAKELISPVVERIKSELGDVVYGVDCESMEKKLVELLLRNKLTVSTAESCTGGMVSQLITNVPGSSEVFGFGVCTYANQAKMKMLGVKEETLEKYGAVSEQTAMEMARGVKELSGSDISLSLTGIAGPGGGTEQKPVGLVYIGVCAGEKCYAKKLLLAQHGRSDRGFIRTLAAKNALKAAIDEAGEIKQSL